MKITIKNEPITLYPEMAIGWNTNLLIADTHFGKIRHFRKSGLALPHEAGKKNLEKLVDIITKSKPNRVYFLGDLFHSHYNEEWEEINQILDYFSAVEFILIEGNHDILSDYRYKKSRLEIKEKEEMGPFILTHLPMEASDIEDGKYNLCGHIHPAVVLTGKGRQALRLPCFYFNEKQGILPAFGIFTGFKTLSIKENDEVYVAVNGQIVKK